MPVWRGCPEPTTAGASPAWPPWRCRGRRPTSGRVAPDGSARVCASACGPRPSTPGSPPRPSPRSSRRTWPTSCSTWRRGARWPGEPGSTHRRPRPGGRRAMLAELGLLDGDGRLTDGRPGRDARSAPTRGSRGGARRRRRDATGRDAGRGWSRCSPSATSTWPAGRNGPLTSRTADAAARPRSGASTGAGGPHPADALRRRSSGPVGPSTYDPYRPRELDRGRARCSRSPIRTGSGAAAPVPAGPARPTVPAGRRERRVVAGPTGWPVRPRRRGRARRRHRPATTWSRWRRGWTATDVGGRARRGWRARSSRLGRRRRRRVRPGAPARGRRAARRPLADPPPEPLVAALLDGVRRRGLGAPRRRRRRDRAWRQRVLSSAASWATTGPTSSDDALLAGLDEWLGPAPGARPRRRRPGPRRPRRPALRAPAGGRSPPSLDRLAPTHVKVPSGSRVARRLRRRPTRPAGADPGGVRLDDTPTVAGGRVPLVLHLLSPAGRPAQVTRTSPASGPAAYAQVRAELRGRYPKHAWPDDPAMPSPPGGPTAVADVRVRSSGVPRVGGNRLRRAAEPVRTNPAGRYCGRCPLTHPDPPLPPPPPPTPDPSIPTPPPPHQPGYGDEGPDGTGVHAPLLVGGDGAVRSGRSLEASTSNGRAAASRALTTWAASSTQSVARWNTAADRRGPRPIRSRNGRLHQAAGVVSPLRPGVGEQGAHAGDVDASGSRSSTSQTSGRGHPHVPPASAPRARARRRATPVVCTSTATTSHAGSRSAPSSVASPVPNPTSSSTGTRRPKTEVRGRAARGSAHGAGSGARSGRARHACAPTSVPDGP